MAALIQLLIIATTQLKSANAVNLQPLEAIGIT
ncbi:MAG: hypothetical protein ACI9KK_002483 [Ascidiaceihabitans sp.]|jgi:hypothetical protein